MSRCVIVGGANIGNYAAARAALRADDFVIYCDCGLKHQKEFGAAPDLIVGDFDSYDRPQTAIETIVLPREKDDTDTMFAVREACRRGFNDFLLLGVVGQRFDHTFGNISILLLLDSMGKRGAIVDDESRMELIAGEKVTIEPDCSYFSLLALGGDARGVTIRNAKYELTDADITCHYQYGISNECLPGKAAEVTVREGRLLLVKVFPEMRNENGGQ